MTDTFKILGQAALGATTLTDVYTVPASTEAVISSVIVCERGGSDTTFRISLSPDGAADATSQYLYYDTTLFANDSFVATLGLTLGDTDVVRVYTAGSSVTATVVGVEIT